MACVYDGISLTNGRAVNMDSLLLKSRTVAGTEVCLAAVCDGVGSLADGALSAQWASRCCTTGWKIWRTQRSWGRGCGTMCRP